MTAWRCLRSLCRQVGRSFSLSKPHRALVILLSLCPSRAVAVRGRGPVPCGRGAPGAAPPRDQAAPAAVPPALPPTNPFHFRICCLALSCSCQACFTWQAHVCRHRPGCLGPCRLSCIMCSTHHVHPSSLLPMDIWDISSF